MDFTKKHSNLKIFLLLFAILFLAYVGSFKGDWVFDDKVNITKNEKLHIESLSIEALKPAVFGSGLDFSRPLSMFTLALNWYFGGDNAVGYHVVNFVIHLLNAFFLFLCVKQLWYTPVGRKLLPETDHAVVISLFAALLWALHPIQIQGVTYIVQRMAAMSSMFCVIGLYCFLRGKAVATKSGKAKAYILCLLSFILGMASKENAVLLPCILILTNLVFFKEQSFTKNQKRLLGFLISCALAIIVVMFVVYYKDILVLYENRFFTPWQRLMTESRVLFRYLSQIFWPLPYRFSIEHYVPLSTSLVSPVTTLFSCMGIVALVVLALVKMRRWPLLAYAILFYFGCHAVESTIMPLELVYEHRNYLPSMFIGLPIAYGFFRLWESLKRGRGKYARAVIGVGAAILVFLGGSTYLRNNVWADETALYEAAVKLYPQATRAHLVMAEYYYSLDTPATDVLALASFEKAFAAGNFHNKSEYSEALSRFISFYITIGETDKAIALAMQKTRGDYSELIFVANGLWESGNYAKAQDVFNKTIAYIDNNKIENLQGRDNLWANIGFGYIAMELYPEAYACYFKLFSTTSGSKLTSAWFLLGLARLQNRPLPEEPLAFLKSLSLQETDKAFNFLSNNSVIPEKLKAAWVEIYNEHFKAEPPEKDDAALQNFPVIS